MALSLLVAFSASDAYAEYEETGFRLAHNPTIYAVTPPPDPTIPNLDLELFQKTQSAILDWKNQLNIGGGKKPVWDMNLVEISSSQVNSDPSKLSQADIQIFYLPSPTSTPDVEEPVGVTTYDVANHKAKIIIYYKKLTFSIVTTETRDSNYIYYHYTPVSSYSDQLAPDAQLSMTIEHELGHAFGLGHYKISEAESDAILSGKETELPSIMTPIVVPIGTNHYSITNSDVQQLKSLYRSSGFASLNTTPDQTSIPASVSTPALPNQIPSQVKYNAYYWSIGNIGNDGFVKVIQWMVLQKVITLPPSTQAVSSQTVIPSWVKKDAKLWAGGEITDDDFFIAIQYLIDNKIIVLNQ